MSSSHPWACPDSVGGWTFRIAPQAKDGTHPLDVFRSVFRRMAIAAAPLHRIREGLVSWKSAFNVFRLAPRRPMKRTCGCGIASPTSIEWPRLIPHLMRPCNASMRHVSMHHVSMRHTSWRRARCNLRPWSCRPTSSRWSTRRAVSSTS